uniref:Uncharacterized protein n=1 Tax=Magnetococcus massalia (strain MO-1) TaxID=451514 RepID=A0A1S7LFU5_MAGMO|nr:conserved protein of unknown function [Candidatus Magnetococcus massalia]
MSSDSPANKGSSGPTTSAPHGVGSALRSLADAMDRLVDCSAPPAETAVANDTDQHAAARKAHESYVQKSSSLPDPSGFAQDGEVDLSWLQGDDVEGAWEALEEQLEQPAEGSQTPGKNPAKK